MFIRAGKLALALAGGLIIMSAPVRAGFSAAFPVSTGGDLGAGFCQPRVAVDRDGDAVFTWQRLVSAGTRSRVEARRRSAAGELGPTEIVSGLSTSSLDHRLAIDAGGDAVITWSLQPASGPLHAQFRTFSAGGALGPIKNLTTVLPAHNARAAMNARGQAVFVWRRFNQSDNRGTVETRTLSPAGTLGPIKRLPLAGTDTFAPDVAINSDGEAAFTWLRVIDGSRSLVQARRRSATGAFALIRQNLGPGVNPPQVAIDDGGKAIVTWPDNGNPRRVWMRTLSATNALGARQPISQGTQQSSAAEDSIAMNAAGDAVFTFRQNADPDGRFMMRARSSTGVFNPQQRLSPPGLILFSNTPGVIDAHRRSLFVWVRVRPEGGPALVEARTRSAIGNLGPVEKLSINGALDPQIAMNARGQGVIAWCEVNTQGVRRVFGATFSP